MFQFFQHQYARAFADNEAVAAFVPRTGSGGGVVVAGGEGFHRGKTAHAQSADCAFRAAGNHYVRVAVFDQSGGIADGVRAGGTGGNHPVARAAVAFEDGNVSGNQVDQRTGDKERVDFARAAFDYGFAGDLDAGQSADAGADVHADAVFVEVFHIVQARIGDCLQCGGNAVVDEYVHPARFFRADVLSDVETAHFAGDTAVDVGCVKAGNRADAAFAGEQGVPSLCDSVADRGNLT